MRACVSDDVDGNRGDARNPALELGNFVGVIASFIIFFVPGGMAVIAENKLGANAANPPGPPSRLDVAQVTEELEDAGQSFGDDRVLGAFLFQLDDVEDELAGGGGAAQGLRQREKPPPWGALG